LFAAFDPVEPAPPPAPQVLSAVRVSSPLAGVEVSWLKPDNGGSPLTGYNVYRGATSGAEVFIAHVTGADTTKYVDQTADPVNNSFYKVMAVNAVGESTYCRELSVNAVQPSQTACQAPYLMETGPGTPGVPDETMGELTIQRVGMGEPFVSCDNKSLVVQMKVTTMDPGHTGQATPPPNSIWQILFTVPGTVTSDGQAHTIFVTADTEGIPVPTAATVQYNYGYRGAGPTGSFDATDSCLPGGLLPCPVRGSMTADGTITITLDISQPISFSDTSGTLAPFTLNRMPVGTTLTQIQGQTSLLIGAAPGGNGGGFSETISLTAASGTYRLVGNVNCSAGVPIAGLTATPMSGSPPLSVNFDGSSSTDTSPCATIASYTLDFGDGSPAVTQASPAFSHTYNNPGDYPARLTVTDTAGRTSNFAQVVITVASTQIEPSGIVSRKVHGTAGTFDIIFPGTGMAIEPRAAGNTETNGVDYELVFVFPNTLSSVASVSASATGPAQPTSVSGSISSSDAHQYIVNLTGVPNAQTITVTLNNAADSTGATGNVSTAFGLLIGDSNADGFVNSGDIGQTKSRSGQAVSSANFRSDLNADGFLNSADISLVKSKSGTALP
jgi:PKD repeat protein